ncbi:hypothetical protein ACLB2K_062872 [Fragaria x ananassa]
MSSRDPYFQFVWDSTVHGEVELEMDDDTLGIRSLSVCVRVTEKIKLVNFFAREVAPELSFAWTWAKTLVSHAHLNPSILNPRFETLDSPSESLTMSLKKKSDPLSQRVDQCQNLGGSVPNSSENTISNCRTAVIEGSKPATNEANPKRERPSKKGASNKAGATDSVNESAVIGQIAKEVVAGSSRPEIRECAKESVHVEEVVPQNDIEVYTTLDVKTETHINKDVMQARKDWSFISPRKYFRIGKKRRAYHGSSLFNYINIQHKQSHPQKKLRTVRLELSQQWKDLPFEEKQKYMPEPNPFESLPCSRPTASTKSNR